MNTSDIPAFIREGRCQYANGQPSRLLCYDGPAGPLIITMNGMGLLHFHSPDGKEVRGITQLDLVELPEPAGDWADAAACEIGKDIQDRRDWKHVWNTTDKDVINKEIIPAWVAIIRKHQPQPPRSEPSDARVWDDVGLPIPELIENLEAWRVSLGIHPVVLSLNRAILFMKQYVAAHPLATTPVVSHGSPEVSDKTLPEGVPVPEFRYFRRPENDWGWRMPVDGSCGHYEAVDGTWSGSFTTIDVCVKAMARGEVIETNPDGTPLP